MKRITVLLVILIFVASCAKDSDDVINTELEGVWTLNNVSCFCNFGFNPDFSTHKLIFEGSILKVENSGVNEFLTNAEGPYTVEGNLITLKNGAQYKYVIKEDSLELNYVDDSQIADDEFYYQYIKN